MPFISFGNLLTSSNYYDKEEKVTDGGGNGNGAEICNIFSAKLVLETASSDEKKLFKIETCIYCLRCVSTLHLGENGINVEMAGVLLSISRYKSMKKLILNKNFRSQVSLNHLSLTLKF